MATRVGWARWPGVEDLPNSANYTYRHGAAPSVATITLPINSKPLPTGTLIFTDGANEVLIRDAKLHEWIIDFRKGTTTISILDRRWRWAFTYIEGAYNVRGDGQNFQPGTTGPASPFIASTIRTVRQLAELCLQQMGEARYSLDGLPLNEYPGTHWDMVTAAEALESLCQQYDCQICLPPTTDVVSIVRRGTGSAPPGNIPIAESAPTIDVPEIPTVVVVMGSDIEFEVLLRLKAVGDNTDGRILPIDELFYAPKQMAPQIPASVGTVWGCDPPPTFGNIPQFALLPDQDNSDAQHAWIHQLAAGSVFKKFQVDLSKNAANEDRAPEIPGFFGPNKSLALTRLDQFIIHAHRVQVGFQSSGFTTAMPAELSGVFARDHQWGEADTDAAGNSRNSERVFGSFSVDGRHNLITYAHYLYKRFLPGAAYGFIAPPDLLLRCAITVRDLTTYAPFRYLYGLATGAKISSGSVVIRRPELIMRVLTRYQNDNPGTSDPAIYRPLSTDTNKQDLDTIAAAFAAAGASYYQIRGGGQWTYPGILPLVPNGSLQEITWSISVSNPPSTTASQNRSHANWLPTLEEVRTRFFVRPIVLGDPPVKRRAIERTMRATRVIPGLEPGVGPPD